MKIIITMAGEGSRFKKAGIKKPKHKITTRGKTLFEYSMISLKSFFDNEFIFVGRQKHDNEKFIASKCSGLGIKKYKIISLEGVTKGQANTALKAEKEIEDFSEPIIIYNIDTYIESDVLNPTDIKRDGWIPCFKAEGKRWSFVKTKEDSLKAVKVVEKERVSNLASVGLYYFSSFNLLKEAYINWSYKDVGEEYIAPLYNYLIENTYPVFVEVVDEDKTHILGTPKDINKFDPKFNAHRK